MNAMHFEGISGAINVSIVAFSIVFAVLLGLTVVIYAMRLFAGGSAPKPEGNAPAAKASQAVAPAAAPAASSTPVASAAAQTMVVAAITAAILAATDGQGKILSITPETVETNNASRWTRTWKTSGVLDLTTRSLDRGWKR